MTSARNETATKPLIPFGTKRGFCSFLVQKATILLSVGKIKHQKGVKIDMGNTNKHRLLCFNIKAFLWHSL